MISIGWVSNSILRIPYFTLWQYGLSSLQGGDTKFERFLPSMKKKWERFRWFLTQKINYESQTLALFDTSPLHQFSKFNNFLWIWVCCFSILYSLPPLKLDNLYCHSLNFPRVIPLFDIFLRKYLIAKCVALKKVKSKLMLLKSHAAEYYWLSWVFKYLITLLCSKLTSF